MQLRQSLGVDPNHKFTNEEIEQLKKNITKAQHLFNYKNGATEHTIFDKDDNVIKSTPYSPSVLEEAKTYREYGEEGSFNILNRYSTNFIRQILNDVASTKKQSKYQV